MEASKTVREVIPGVLQTLCEAYETARNIDEQLYRLERADGRDRDKKITSADKPEQPAPYIELEEKAETLLKFLSEIEAGLRKEVALLLGSFS